jgi:hypothetical protein
VTPIVCAPCGVPFVPKEKGFNAKHCSDRCKRRSQTKRLQEANPQQRKTARARSYLQTKAHPERMATHRARAKKYRNLAREWLATYKMSIGCVDCGYAAHPAALQLDHEGPKSVDIAEARSSIRRLKAEIENGQCRVRCANCHSIRTWQTKQSVLP